MLDGGVIIWVAPARINLDPASTDPRIPDSMSFIPSKTTSMGSVRPPGSYGRSRIGALPLVPVVLVALTLGARAPAAGQSSSRPDGSQPASEHKSTKSCPEGVVGRIQIRNHSLFTPDRIRNKPFAWALELANWAHIRTRADYLRSELLLSEGDCYNPEALDESLRLIRESSFIARARAEPHQLPDSTWNVQVETWDEWTTELSVNLAVEESSQFKGAAITEKDLLGRGLIASVGYHRFREREDLSVLLGTPRFLGTRANASVRAGSTRTGSFFDQEISYPFVGEMGRVSFDSHVQYEDHEYSWVTGGRGGVSHVLLPLNDRSVLVRGARRFGKPGALRMLGGEVEVQRRKVSGPVRQVLGSDFEGATGAPDSLAAVLGRQGTPDSWVRLGVTAGLRRIHFVTRSGLDLVSGVQDVALGSDLDVTLGRALGTWHTSALDTYGRIDGYLGGASGPLIGVVRLRAEGRHLDSAPGSTPWRDLSVASRADGYWKPGPGEIQTLVGSVRFDGRWNADQPYQTVLGSSEGVRSYRDDQVPAARVLVARLEERLHFGWFRPAADFGLTFFGDVGRAWAGDTPFATNTSWRKAVGAGLLIGFPSGTGNVARVTLAWPVGGPDASAGPILRIYWSPIRTHR